MTFILMKFYYFSNVSQSPSSMASVLPVELLIFSFYLEDIDFLPLHTNQLNFFPLLSKASKFFALKSTPPVALETQ